MTCLLQLLQIVWVFCQKPVCSKCYRHHWLICYKLHVLYVTNSPVYLQQFDWCTSVTTILLHLLQTSCCIYYSLPILHIIQPVCITCYSPTKNQDESSLTTRLLFISYSILPVCFSVTTCLLVLFGQSTSSVFSLCVSNRVLYNRVECGNCFDRTEQVK